MPPATMPKADADWLKYLIARVAPGPANARQRMLSSPKLTSPQLVVGEPGSVPMHWYAAAVTTGVASAGVTAGVIGTCSMSGNASTLCTGLAASAAGGDELGLDAHPVAVDSEVVQVMVRPITH
jgi:hypothetical protein